MWMTILHVCFKSLKGNNLLCLQLKFIHKIFSLKEYLGENDEVNTAECSYCQEGKFILHMFVECKRMVDFWMEIELLMFQTISFKVKFSAFDKLLGCQNGDQTVFF